MIAVGPVAGLLVTGAVAATVLSGLNPVSWVTGDLMALGIGTIVLGVILIAVSGDHGILKAIGAVFVLTGTIIAVQPIVSPMVAKAMNR